MPFLERLWRISANGLVLKCKFSLANFATKDATSWQIFSIFWKAIGICELECGLKIIGVTCDGASVNRKFFRMHSSMIGAEDSNGHVDVVYRIRNEFSQFSVLQWVVSFTNSVLMLERQLHSALSWMNSLTLST